MPSISISTSPAVLSPLSLPPSPPLPPNRRSIGVPPSPPPQRQPLSLLSLPFEVISHILTIACGRGKGLEDLMGQGGVGEGIDEGWSGWGGVMDPRETGWVGENELRWMIDASLIYHRNAKRLLPVCRLFYLILLPTLWCSPTITSPSHLEKFSKTMNGEVPRWFVVGYGERMEGWKEIVKKLEEFEREEKERKEKQKQKGKEMVEQPEGGRKGKEIVKGKKGGKSKSTEESTFIGRKNFSKFHEEDIDVNLDLEISTSSSKSFPSKTTTRSRTSPVPKSPISLPIFSELITTLVSSTPSLPSALPIPTPPPNPNNPTDPPPTSSASVARQMSKSWAQVLPTLLPQLPNLRRFAMGDLVWSLTSDELQRVAESVGKAGRGKVRNSGKGMGAEEVGDGPGLMRLDMLDLAPLTYGVRSGGIIALAPPGGGANLGNLADPELVGPLLDRMSTIIEMIASCEGLKSVSTSGLVIMGGPERSKVESRLRRALELGRRCGIRMREGLGDKMMISGRDDEWGWLEGEELELGPQRGGKGKAKAKKATPSLPSHLISSILSSPFTHPIPNPKPKLKPIRDDRGLEDLFFGTATELGISFLWDLADLAPGLKELHIDAWAHLIKSDPGKKLKFPSVLKKAKNVPANTESEDKNKTKDKSEVGTRSGEGDEKDGLLPLDYKMALRRWEFLNDKALDLTGLMERLGELDLSGLTLGFNLGEDWTQGFKGNCDNVMKLFPRLRDLELRADFIGMEFWRNVVAHSYIPANSAGTNDERILTHPLKYFGIHVAPPNNPGPATTVDVFVYADPKDILSNAVAIVDFFGEGDLAWGQSTGWFELLVRTGTMTERNKKMT